MSQDSVKIHRGLVGVYFDRTKTTYINGKEGILEYCGYNIHDLAENSTFEETAYLLLNGKLPNQSELDQFNTDLINSRSISPKIIDIIRSIKDAHPMDVLRTSVSALSTFDEEAADKSYEATMRKGIRLTSQVPTIRITHVKMFHS